MSGSQQVLICTLGAEPQVVTLSLDALLQLGIPITRVDVVHTLDDREPIRGAIAQLKHEFLNVHRYGENILFNSHLLAGVGGPLKDVVSHHEIETAFQSLFVLIRQHKYAGRIVHLCIAGGRKTMALFAMGAAQFLFDSRDRVWHLISSPALLASRQLHAINPDDVQLVSVPILHLPATDGNRARAFLEQHLTSAEREVATLLAREGLSNAALARRLNKSPKTIANQLSSVYSKLTVFYGLSEPADRTTLLALLGRNS